MNVRTLCLSILYEQESSGYEIRKMCTEGECSYFVEASFGSIYPALARLEDEGLVTSRIEHQAGKPSKKTYVITDAGRDAFVESLTEPLGDDVFRSPFLLLVRFAHLLPEDLVRTRLDDKLTALDAEIDELRKMKSDLDKEERSGAANDQWVLDYGLSCLEAARKHLAGHMHELIASAKSDERLPTAAE